MRTAAWVDAYVRSEMWHCRSECAFCACMSLHRGTTSSVCLCVCVTECAAIYMYETNVPSFVSTSVWVFWFCFFFCLDAACTILWFYNARLICISNHICMSSYLPEGEFRTEHYTDWIAEVECDGFRTSWPRLGTRVSVYHTSERHLKALDWNIAIHWLLTTNKLLRVIN